MKRDRLPDDNDLFLRDADDQLVSVASARPIRDIASLLPLLPVLGGNSITMAPSGIAGAGNGLFALRDFDNGEVVTFYDSVVIRYVPPHALPRSLRSHARNLLRMRWTLLGNHPLSQFGVAGHGGGALINHASRPNVSFMNLNSDGNTYALDHMDYDRFNPFQSLVVVRASRPIRAGEEFLASYGQDYWQRDDVDDDLALSLEEITRSIVRPGDLVSQASTPDATKKRRIIPTPISTCPHVDPITWNGGVCVDLSLQLVLCESCAQ